jgi:predicted GIY-YIG superfamily endonuclease
VTAGVVYLLHLDAPGYAHAKHYTGWTADLPARLALHEAGQGARLLAVAHAAGIGWTLARTWPGTRARERQLKRQGGASRRCPLCGITPRADGHVPFDSRSDAAPGAAGQRRGLSHTHT